MTENWKKQLDDGEKALVIFMDLSKAFDTTNHSLLLAKLKTWFLRPDFKFITKLNRLEKQLTVLVAAGMRGSQEYFIKVQF